MFALVLLLFGFLLQYSDAAAVDSITKCSYKENNCMRKVFLKFIKDYGATGVEELNMAPIDPLDMTNVTLTALDAITLTIVEGAVRGLKDCDVLSFNVDLEKQLGSQDLYCEVLTVKGSFAIGGTNQMLQSLFGTKSLNGNGKAEAKFEKVSMHLDLPVAVVRKKDGEIYLHVTGENPKYTYDLENATFDFKNLIIGNSDLSQFMTAYMNSNWKTFFKAFGNIFADKGLEFLIIFAKQFYDNIPTKYYIIEDLSHFLKN